MGNKGLDVEIELLQTARPTMSLIGTSCFQLLGPYTVIKFQQLSADLSSIRPYIPDRQVSGSSNLSIPSEPLQSLPDP